MKYRSIALTVLAVLIAISMASSAVIGEIQSSSALLLHKQIASALSKVSDAGQVPEESSWTSKGSEGKSLLSRAEELIGRMSGYVDPTLYEIEGPTRVIAIVRDSVPLSDVAQCMISCRATPKMGSFYIVLGVLDKEHVDKLATLDGLVAVTPDVNLAERAGLLSGEQLKVVPASRVRSLDKQRPVSPYGSAGSPEVTMWDVVEILGATDAWDAGFNGSGITIAFIDTGVDYGAFPLAYPDYVARDDQGRPAAFDADAIYIALTNLTVTAFENASGVFISTAGMDPSVYTGMLIYYGYPPVMKYSDLFEDVWPCDMEVTGILEAGDACKFGVLLQWGIFWFWIVYWPEPVIVVDSNGDGVYDNVYIDHSFYYWAWYGTPYDRSFSDDPPANYTYPIAAKDFTGDGINDASCGSLAFGLDIFEVSPSEEDRGSVLEPIDDKGNYVCFVSDWYGHGTSCANVAAGKYMEHPFVGPGIAPGASIMGITALWLGDFIEGYLWAAGFDLVPGTEGWNEVPGYGTVWGEWQYTGNHKADIISNSWGISDWAYMSTTYGFPWYDVLSIFVDLLMVPGALDPEYPGTVVTFAAGNAGPGYGTVADPAYGTMPITVGASTSFEFAEDEGYAGGYHGEVVSWSSRGPNPLGAPEPDVLSVGAYGYTSVAVWGGYGNGSDAFWLFGGTSMASPGVAGVCAIVIQAYLEAHGEKPSPELVKQIVMSSAEDLGYDPFTQGAGQVNAFKAAALAQGEEGVTVATDATWNNVKSSLAEAWDFAHWAMPWQILAEMPETWYESKWYAGYVRPGETSSATFTLSSLAPAAGRQTIDVELESAMYELIDVEEVSDYTESIEEFWWGYIYLLDPSDIPSDTVLMTVSLTYPYYYLDNDGDYWEDIELYLFIFDWNDTSGDGYVNATEIYWINEAFATGTSQEVCVGFPLETFQYTPVILVWQYGSSDAVPFALKICFWRRTEWDWISFDQSSLSVPVGGSAQFTATLSIPSDAYMGVYEGYILVHVTGSRAYEHTIAIPVSVVVPLVVGEDSLSADVFGPGTPALYDVYSVRGLFDWWWRYNTGDWKLWAIEFDDPTVVGAFVYCYWLGYWTDIDMLAISPSLYITDASLSDYLGAGTFMWGTRTGDTYDFVYVEASPFGLSPPQGTYTVLLHNVLFDGTSDPDDYPEPIEGAVYLIKLSPRGTSMDPITVVTRAGDTIAVNMTLSTGHSLTNMGGMFVALGTQSYITIGDVEADSTVEFQVTFEVPEGTPTGTYTGILFLGSSETEAYGGPIVTYFEIVVDNEPPMLSITRPANGSVVSGTLSAELFAFDENLDRVELYLNDTLLQSWTASGLYTYEINTTAYADGNYVLRAVAYDELGNVAESRVNVTIDNTSPTGQITSPSEGESLTGTVTISVSGSDANLEAIELYIDGALVQSWTEAGDHTYEWDTKQYPDGEHAITLVVRDAAGNTAEVSVSVTTTNWEAERMWNLTIGAVSAGIPLLIVGAVVGFVLARKRG